MADSFIPKIALDYIKNKNLKTGFSYKDVWNEEHATGFTVAKAMQLDVLSDMKSAVEKAIEKGETFEQFKKNLKPTLIQKGWWGKKDMTDPITGETVTAQLGSDRRLKTIYDTNIWSAYSKGSYDRAMESVFVKYFMYRIGYAQKHRAQHVAWDGLVLPKDDAFWDTHYPPNGYGCHCYVTTLTEERKRRYENEGFPTPKMQDGSGGVNMPIKTVAPKEEYTAYENLRKGTVERIPKGITPGFAWNQGKATRSSQLLNSCMVKAADKLPPKQYDLLVKSLTQDKVIKNDFYTFIENCLAKNYDKKYATAAGILDSKTLRFLESKNINMWEKPVVVLESSLVNGVKYTGRHAAMGNAPTQEDWYNIFDYLIDANIYWDGEKLIFLRKTGETTYMKIAVDAKTKIRHKGTSFELPKIDTMYVLDISTETDRGITELNRILKFEKIR